MNHVARIALAMLVGVAAGCATNGGKSDADESVMGGAAKTAEASTQDSSFVSLAAQSSQAEIELAQLAQQKSQSPAIQEFANRMITDHRNASSQLTQAAQGEGITPPQSVAPRHAQMRDQLAQLSGQEFDQQYLSNQVNMHKEAVNLFRQEASRGQSPDLRAFAEQTLPVLEGHLSLAEQLAARAGVSFAD